MGELADILNAAQISKHFELLQFLSKHANVEYTLAQLDYLIPRGASLQRFPKDWVEFMEDGRCSNQNIEVHRRSVCSSSSLCGHGDEDGADTQSELVFICRRPEVTSLEELMKLVHSPATMTDTVGCVALHTDQVVLHEKILKESQQRGLVYFFPDKYGRSREQRGVSGGRSASGLLDVVFQDDDTDAILGGLCSTVRLELPLGMTSQFVLFTCRGVPARGKNAFPVRFNIGERAIVVLERNVTPEEEVCVLVKTPALRVSLGQPAGNSGLMPVDVRVKAPSGSSGSRRSLLDIRAQARGRVALSVFFDEKETIVPVEVVEENGTMPGVLIGRQPLPAFPVPDAIRIPDPMLWGTEMQSEGDRGGTQRGYDPSCHVISWWLNSSPAILRARDLTLPDNDTMAAASRAVWIPHQADEAAIKLTRAALQRHSTAEAAQRNRRKRSRSYELRNSHMLHFGFDASVPFDKNPNI